MSEAVGLTKRGTGFTLTINQGGKKYDAGREGVKFFAKQAKMIGDTITGDDVDRIVTRDMKAVLKEIYKALEIRHSDHWTPSRKGAIGSKSGRLAKRSGNMLKGIEESIKVYGNGTSKILGEISGGTVAYVHEFGAVIRAKKAKFLTIPLPAALNSDGTPRKLRARDWDRTFIKKSKKGALVIYQKRGKTIMPLYLLLKSVEIKPRLGMSETVHAAAQPFAEAVMNDLTVLMRKKIKEAMT